MEQSPNDYTAGTGSGGGTEEFRLGDEVGTLFAKVNGAGTLIEACASGPFGEGLQCSPSIDYTETHFTDKKRDAESMLNYLGRVTTARPWAAS